MNKITNKCQPKECKWLWFKWKEETHEWAYFDSEHRVCEKCGYEEIQIKYIFDYETRYKWVKKA